MPLDDPMLYLLGALGFALLVVTLLALLLIPLSLLAAVRRRFDRRLAVRSAGGRPFRSPRIGERAS